MQRIVVYVKESRRYKTSAWQALFLAEGGRYHLIVIPARFNSRLTQPFGHRNSR